MRFWALFLLCSTLPAPAQRLSQLKIKTPIPTGETLVIGFLGGWEDWDSKDRSVRQVAIRLQRAPGLHAASIENHKAGTAEKLVKRSFDRNRNKKLDPDEKANARVIIYGQSMGGGAAIALARKLESWGIPVILTAQVDSFGLRDSLIPPNVKTAVNFYQREWLTIRGEDEIRAEDPARTEILGNFRMYYPVFVPYPRKSDSWLRKTFGGGHARMEADPLVWHLVEKLIREAAEGKPLTRPPLSGS
jgi:pimeloyl-ACP methyl ester carboxylesterase